MIVSSGRQTLYMFVSIAVLGLCQADFSAVEASGAALLECRLLIKVVPPVEHGL